MTSIKTYLHDLLNNGRKRAILATVTFLFAVLILWPVADEYRQTRARRLDLEHAYSTLDELAERRKQLEDTRQNLDGEVARVESQAVTTSELGAFRNELVKLVRDSKCHIRQIEEGEMQSRPWLEDDDPLMQHDNLDDPDGVGANTNYLLKSHPLAVNVSGAFADVSLLLAKIHESKRMMFTRSVTLRPDESGENNVYLQLDLILFHLEENQSDEGDADWETDVPEDLESSPAV